MKTLIFDLDGTILDTLIDLKNAVNHALNVFNLPNKSLEFVRLAIGNGTQVLIKRCTPESIDEEKRKEVFNCFKRYYLEHYDDYTKPYHGVANLLKKYQGQCRFAVVSNKDHDLVIKLINKEFPNLFNIIQGSYLDKPKKPDPYLINKIIKENELEISECLYIGDTDVDKLSAINAGLKYLLVNYGYRTKEELIKACPEDKSISSVEELNRYIDKWVNS